MKKILINIYLCITLISFSQPQLKFSRYTTRQGLANNDVLCICQDTLGFMWFGTKNGCSRFDGAKFKNFQYSNKDKGTIAAGWVNHIVCDKHNNLWFALAGGKSTLMRFDYISGKFNDYSSKIKKLLNKDAEIFSIFRLFIDSDGIIWMQTDITNGLFRYDPNINSIQKLQDYYKKHGHLSYVKDFYEDKQKNIWFITTGGIVVYNKRENTFKHINHDESNPGSLSSDKGQCLFEDMENNLWIGTQNGLNLMLSHKKSAPLFRHYVHEPSNLAGLSHNFIYDITQDDKKRIFIATVNGLNMIDISSGEIHRYRNNITDNTTINSNLVRVLHTDNMGNVWIGTSQGVGKLQKANFKSFTYNMAARGLSHSKVESMCKGQENGVFIGSPIGIDIFDEPSQKFLSHIPISNQKNGLPGIPISMFPDGKSGMWIGTWDGGLNYYDNNTKQVSHFFSDSILAESDVFAVLKDSKNRLWIDCQANGLYVVDLKTMQENVFYSDINDKNSLSSNFVRTISEDNDSAIWIGTINGLNKVLHTKKSTFKRYLEGIEINHLLALKHNNSIFVGTNSGLYKYNNTGDDFFLFESFEKNVQDNRILALMEDKDGNVWLSTESKIIKIRLVPDGTYRYTVFRHEEGFPPGDFLPRSCAYLNNGSMLFGSTGGFCLFHPREIKADTIPAKVVFTNLKVAGRSVSAQSDLNGQMVLQNTMPITESLVLNHKNNVFTIEFVGIHYNMPQYIQYKYKLEGYDSDTLPWHTINAQNANVEYMNLPHGEYVFKVKASNCHGLWNDQPSQLNIKILPPWWKTIWFKVSIGGFVFVVVVLIIRIRTYSLNKQKVNLEKLVRVRTNELKEMNTELNERKEELEQQMMQMMQMNEELKAKSLQVEDMAKKLHQADQLKLRFFANISHEFRTPLTLIIGPLEKCLSIGTNTANLKNYMQLMHKNAKRLLRLVNQIIDFRKIDQHRKELKITNNNIIEFIQGAIEIFTEFAKQKNIEIAFQIEHPSKNIDHLTFIKNHIPFTIENLSKKSVQARDEKFENNDLSNKEDQMRNDKYKMIHDFWFDPDILEKVLYNLISNAIKYTPEGGKILITIGVGVETRHALSLPNNQLVIKIIDTGIGIKPENLEKIFDRFYRVETNASFKEEGTGIGLSYTRELVELHKGKIEVSSKPGKGTVFTLIFPLGIEKQDIAYIGEKQVPLDLKYIRSMVELPLDGQKQESNSIENNEVDVNQNRSKQNILVVEDNDDLRKFIVCELSDEYKIHQAENGKKAWEMLQNLKPDVIISDIVMPELDGIELCKRIKTSENTSHIPVILLTAKSGIEEQIIGLETGADDYITKPFNVIILKMKLKNLFELRRKIHAKFNGSLNVLSEKFTHTNIDETFLQDAVDVVIENIQDSDFSNNDFVSKMNFSRTLVYTKIKALTGKSVSEFIRSMRLKAAAELFMKGNDNVTDVAYKVGFKHQSTLSFHFSKTFGKSPTQFIKENPKK